MGPAGCRTSERRTGPPCRLDRHDRQYSHCRRRCYRRSCIHHLSCRCRPTAIPRLQRLHGRQLAGLCSDVAQPRTATSANESVLSYSRRNHLLIQKHPGCRLSRNNLPGIPAASPSTGHGGLENVISTDAPLTQLAVSVPAQGRPINELPPFHTITIDGVICGVDDKKTTACKDPQGRGFVLSPSWSGWLPHI